jgi:hypothetical protein
MPLAVVVIEPVVEVVIPVVVLVVDWVPVVGEEPVVGEDPVVDVVVSVEAPPEPESSPQPRNATEAPMQVNKNEKRRNGRFMVEPSTWVWPRSSPTPQEVRGPADRERKKAASR